MRLLKGDYDRVTKYNLDPLVVLEEFKAKGAELVHIVDLDAARNGNRAVNREAIARLATFSGLRFELGGGLRTMDDLSQAFASGIDRAILGTAIIKNPDFLLKALKKYGADRIIAGVDSLEGTVRVSGWEEDSNRSLFSFLEELQDKGVREIIFTEISRDGAFSGPPLMELQQILERTDLSVIASGGIASLDDLKALLSLRSDRLTGAISGRAIYEGRLDLAAAISLLRS